MLLRVPDPSPKDRFVTVYGRKPVLEVLDDADLDVDKVILADTARGAAANEILSAARARGVVVQRATAQRVKVLAGNGKQDQGVLADVVAPKMRLLTEALRERAPRTVLVLDGITTPANVGMILRTATAAGIGGIVVPRRGVASIDPLVIKASAGVAFRAPVLRTATALDAATELHQSGYRLFGLAGTARASIFTATVPTRSAFVLGGETAGVSDVASAAAVVCFELLRRRTAAS
jgi:23S rRNA (guanosine2251-2'-O)-methyltransferase